MSVEETTPAPDPLRVQEECAALGQQFPTWRIGRGGSGRWWAVRHSDYVHGWTAEELRARLSEYTAADGRDEQSGPQGEPHAP